MVGVVEILAGYGDIALRDFGLLLGAFRDYAPVSEDWVAS